ncbi:MAG: hypothetical protein JOY82_17540 [Streptosporangiaceae bacterium]|nr:hypothetical protein [Streptosporangiaceae bacterium]
MLLHRDAHHRCQRPEVPAEVDPVALVDDPGEERDDQLPSRAGPAGQPGRGRRPQQVQAGGHDDLVP